MAQRDTLLSELHASEIAKLPPLQVSVCSQQSALRKRVLVCVHVYEEDKDGFDVGVSKRKSAYRYKCVCKQ